jgi:hypothetical protein
MPEITIKNTKENYSMGSIYYFNKFKDKSSELDVIPETECNHSEKIDNYFGRSITRDDTTCENDSMHSRIAEWMSNLSKMFPEKKVCKNCLFKSDVIQTNDVFMQEVEFNIICELIEMMHEHTFLKYTAVIDMPTEE